MKDRLLLIKDTVLLLKLHINDTCLPYMQEASKLSLDIKDIDDSVQDLIIKTNTLIVNAFIDEYEELEPLENQVVSHTLKIEDLDNDFNQDNPEGD